MKIAVFPPNWIGDAVMATPALRALRDHFPNASLIGVIKPYVAGVLEGTRWLNDFVFLNNKGPENIRWPAVSARLRQEKVDLAILFPNSFHSAWVAWLGKCQRRIGYARYGRSLLLTDRLPPIQDANGRLAPSPVIDAYNRLVERAGIPSPGHRMELATTLLDERAADVVWEQAKFHHLGEIICFNPGAAFGSAKYWPAESFARLAQTMADRRGAGILVLSGPSEQALARQIVHLANRPSVHCLEGQPLSIGLTKACVRRADLLITTDSGPRHFAAAFDRPVVTLFGPTHIAWTETYYPQAIHLQKKVACGPCQLRVCPLDHRCMTGLTPEDVFEAASNLLARCKPSSRQPIPKAG